MLPRKFRKLVALIVLPAFFFGALPSVARAELVSVQDLVPTAQQAEILSFLERSDVERVLVRSGVDPSEAKSRVSRLTETEAANFAREIHRLPAGGDGVSAVVGGILIIFLVLLLTDILGLTKVFPFTRSVGRR